MGAIVGYMMIDTEGIARDVKHDYIVGRANFLPDFHMKMVQTCV
jgi:hypothetical protein